MKKDSRIYVAGHNGLVGSAIYRNLLNEGYENLIVKDHADLDLTRQIDVENFFKEYCPEYVFLSAAKVGGILANNTYPGDFIYINLSIQNNVLKMCKDYGSKTIFLGSSCIYPRDAAQPIFEESLLTGTLEQTNEAYAVAKIAGLKTCQYFNRQYGTNLMSIMPSNVYGPGDNFDPHNSHVLAGLLRRFHEAKKTGNSKAIVWGSGSPRREFIHVDDLAQACIFLMENYDAQDIQDVINIGAGYDIQISELAKMIARIVEFEGEIVFDTTKPDGTPRKLLNIDRIMKLGWNPQVSLEKGILETYRWAKEHVFI